MKRNFIQVTLPMEQPDSCQMCPLLGIVPKGMRPKGSKESHVCLGTLEAMSGRGVKILASSRDATHPLRRPCDKFWNAWMQFPGRKFSISNQYYLQCRVPYEQGRQLLIKFH